MCDRASKSGEHKVVWSNREHQGCEGMTKVAQTLVLKSLQVMLRLLDGYFGQKPPMTLQAF